MFFCRLHVALDCSVWTYLGFFILHARLYRALLTFYLSDFMLLMLVLFLSSEFCGIYMVIALSISRIPLCSNLQFIKILSVFSRDIYWRWICIGKFFWLDGWFVCFLCWVFLSIFCFSPRVYMLLMFMASLPCYMVKFLSLFLDLCWGHLCDKFHLFWAYPLPHFLCCGGVQMCNQCPFLKLVFYF